MIADKQNLPPLASQLATSAVQSPRPLTMVKEMATVGMPTTPPAGLRQDVFSLAEGDITIQWPTIISRESFEDLSAWIDILKRKIGRSVKTADDVVG
jgi:hypothetical protein